MYKEGEFEVQKLLEWFSQLEIKDLLSILEAWIKAYPQRIENQSLYYP